MFSTCWLMRKPFFDPLVTVTGGPVKLALNHLNVDKNHGLQVDQKSDSVTPSGSKYLEIIFLLYFSNTSFVPIKFWLHF